MKRQRMIFGSPEAAQRHAFAIHLDGGATIPLETRPGSGEWTLTFDHKPSGMRAVLLADGQCELLEEW